MHKRRLISRRDLLHTAGAPLAAHVAGTRAGLAKRTASEPHLNVLLVLVEDFRTDLGCFGSTSVRTPHVDALAASGLTFLRCYCQQAARNPSRISLLTGLRPDSTRIYGDGVHFRRTVPGAITLPQHFRRHGYVTTAFGRIFGAPVQTDRPSWNTAPWMPGSPPWRSPENESLAESNWDRLRENAWLSEPGASGRIPGTSWRMSDTKDAGLPDGQTARAAAAAIRALRDDRFFLAVGFQRPSLPLVAPGRYFDLYPRGTWGAPVAPDPPQDAPSFALQRTEEIRAYDDIPDQGPIPEAKARELIRAYRACVSFVDAQIGLLLEALEEHGLTQSTVVAVAGMNGSHLGELGLWNKNSNYEAATHTPLIVRAPGQRSAGRRTRALVESVDLFPSLCSLCSLSWPVSLEGSSWRGLFDDPKRFWKRAAFSQHPRAIPGIGPGMGYSMRTDRHRYTEWSALDSPYSTVELYDYKHSPNELRNIANRPEHGSLVNGLGHMFREGWRGSLPPPFLPVSSRG